MTDKVKLIIMAVDGWAVTFDTARRGLGWFIRLNRWVLSRCLKVCTVEAFLMAAGISFQILGHSS